MKIFHISSHRCSIALWIDCSHHKDAGGYDVVAMFGDQQLPSGHLPFWAGQQSRADGENLRRQVKKGVEAAELEGSGESNNRARQAC